jgi:hypothetical protein
MSKSKGYSSYPDLQGHFDSWRAYTAAESTVGTPSILKEAIGAAGRGRAGLDKSPEQVAVKGEIVDTAFTEFVSKLQQISKRVIGPINDEQLMQEVQAFLRAQGFVVQGMDVDAGKYANMAEDLSSGSMEYDADSGSPMLDNLEKMVKNYELFGTALVKACQSKYIGQITTSMERLGFGDVEKFLEQVAALTPAKEVAPENDLLKRLLKELERALSLDDYKAIWEKLREVLEKPDAASSEVLVTALEKIKAEAQTEADIQKGLVKLAAHISALEIKNEKWNGRAKDTFMKLAWKEYYADMSFEDAPAEEAEEEAEEEEESPEEKTSEEAPFDLAAAVSSLPKTKKVWEMLVKAKPDKGNDKFKKIFTSGTPNFQKDVEAYVKFIKPFSAQSNASIKEGMIPGSKTINNIGMNQNPLFMKMIGATPPGKTANAWPNSPFKKSTDDMKNALVNLMTNDQDAYNSVLRITAALMSNVRVRNTSGNRKNKSKHDPEAANAIAIGRKKELQVLVSKIQNSAKAAPSQEEPALASDLAKAKPPEGAENDDAEPKWDTPRDLGKQQVAEALDRWKTLAGIITESEEK